MRAAISLLVTSLVFGSLAFNSQSMGNSLSNLLSSNGSGQLLSGKSPGKQPKKTAPYRGSGRRVMMEQVRNPRTVV